MKFENNNKEIIKKITSASLKSNKVRNTFVVLAIVLTTFMISCVFSIGMSFVKNYKTMNIRLAGTTSTTSLNNPIKEQINEIKDLGITTSIGEEINVGKVKDKKLEKNKEKILLKYYDEENWEKQITPAISNIKGKYPTKENEIMASQKALEFLNKRNAKIGDTIKIKFTDVNKKTVEKEFVLSGIYKTYAFIEDKGYFNLSKEYIDSNKLSVEDNGVLNFTLKQKEKDSAPEMLESQVYLNKNQEFSYNYDIYSDVSETGKGTLILALLIGGFIVFSGYLLIYNIMYIAVTKDINFYGLMKTIGTSPRQIKKIVKNQALRLAIIGIPIGLILSVLVSFGIIPMVIKGLTSPSYSNAMPSDVSFNPLIFIGATLFSIFTVIISCKKPAKIASKISPTEALRYSGTKSKKKNKKSTKGGKLHKMAWTNVFRDKKRAILVFLSLFMGIITFLSVNTFLKSLSLDNYIDRYVKNDFEIKNLQVVKSKMDDKLVNEIRNIDGVKSVENMKIGSSTLDYNKKLLLPAIKEGYARFSDKDSMEKFIKQIKKDPATLETCIIGLDNETIERYNKESKEKVNVKSFEEGKLALVDNFFYDKDNKNISGEKLTLRNKDKHKTFDAKLFTDETSLLPDIPVNQLGIPTVYISDSTLKKIDKNLVNYALSINVDEKYQEDINFKLKKIVKERNLEFDSKSEEAKSFTNTYMVMNVLGSGASLILILIGLLNFVNVIITGINVRLGELAIMESIGMTKKQIKKMLTYEGFYYGLITTIIMCTLGSGVVYLIGQKVTEFVDYAKFVFPTNDIIFLIICIFIVCLATPTVVYKYSSKETITERLRKLEK